MSCPICGGAIAGDGITMPLHCEFAECPEDREADAPVYTCRESDDAELVDWEAKAQRYLYVLSEIVLPDELQLPPDVQEDVDNLLAERCWQAANLD